MRLATRSPTWRPTAVEPVKLISGMRWSSTNFFASSVPASLNWKNRSGKPPALSASLQIFIDATAESGVFGDGFTAAHLKGVTTPLFRGPADRRWWHVELGAEAASWTMDVRVDEITGVRFVRAPYPFRPHFPGQEVLGVDFLGPGGDKVLHCGVHDLYEGERMRPEKLAAWRALRERYGNRDESKVDQGTLTAQAA